MKLFKDCAPFPLPSKDLISGFIASIFSAVLVLILDNFTIYMEDPMETLASKFLTPFSSGFEPHSFETFTVMIILWVWSCHPKPVS